MTRPSEGARSSVLVDVVNVVCECATDPGQFILWAQVSHREVKLPDIREGWAHICGQNSACHLDHVGLSQRCNVDLKVTLDPELVNALTSPAPMDECRERDQGVVVVTPQDAILHCVRAYSASIPDVAI